MVRLGTTKDIEQTNIIRKQVNELHVLGEPTVFKGFSKELEEHIKNFVNDKTKSFLVYEKDDKILAYAMLEFVTKPETSYRYEQKYLEVQELGTLEGFKGKGYGKLVMQKIEEIAKQNNFNQIQLNMWTFNDKVLNFYEKIGFENYRKYLRKNI